VRSYNYLDYRIKINYYNEGMVYQGLISTAGGKLLIATTPWKQEGEVEKEAEEICRELTKAKRRCQECEE